MKPYLKLFILFALVLTINSTYSQEIKFVNAPEYYQLYACDKSDSSTVSIHGKIKRGLEYKTILLKTFKDEYL